MKEDWWHLEGSRRIGPRPELVAEYHATCEQPFYMYSLEHFLIRAREHLGQQVGPSALLEIRERSSAERHRDDVKAESTAASDLKQTPAASDPGDVKRESPSDLLALEKSSDP